MVLLLERFGYDGISIHKLLLRLKQDKSVSFLSFIFNVVEIAKIGFDPSGRYLVTAGDKHLLVFHNVVGYRANITDMEKKLKTATSQPMRDRLEMQITQAR